MKRIAILGCENSHANNFLRAIKENEDYSKEYEVVGVYSDEEEPPKKLQAEYGCPILSSYDEAVGKVDGVIITARHGANHYKYAKPYIEAGIPMFIDKPITCDCDEAVKFMRELRAAGVKISGGSSLSQADEIIALREEVATEKDGATVGGVMRAPVQTDSVYGGFWFYAQHLVEMVCSVYGRYPKSVKAFSVGDEKTVVFRYEKYDITGIFVEHGYKYYGVRFTSKTVSGGEIASSPNWFKREFADFDGIMNGGEQPLSYEDFISPVFVIKAIEESLASGEEVAVKKFEI